MALNDIGTSGTPVDALARVKGSVEDWLKRARDALLTFARDDGSFWKDTKAYSENKHANITTTARAYLALVSAETVLTKHPSPPLPSWRDKFCTFISGGKLAISRNGEICEIQGDQPGLNNFDLAHLADFQFTADFLTRFGGTQCRVDVASILCGPPLDIDFSKEVSTRLHGLLAIEAPARGQLPFESGNDDSTHYFVTLHCLRAVEIIKGNPLEQPAFKSLHDGARTFCIEQCLYSARDMRHEQDVVRLTFAGVIHCLYGEPRDQELFVAVIEALEKSQQKNGSWPATHPVFRRQGGPWHIASHELALCLTWLYFQPQLPDRARAPLVSMMERYFLHYLVPTFGRVVTPRTVDGVHETKPFAGWVDDHTVAKDTAVGWATAIVCHFLANYYGVLSHYMNRRVIETLRLDNDATGFVIDGTHLKRSKRFARRDRTNHAIWIDLPPLAWKPQSELGRLVNLLQAEWTDPSMAAELSYAIVERLLAPIFACPSHRPDPHFLSGILPGSPGTRKTTLVTIIAELLQWPLVPLPASAVFERGFDLMEAQASLVFGLLNHLTGCVIFFDEFEEFFLARNADIQAVGSTHDRTIAAFTTSAMLPRLQELHNRGTCLVFLATNHFDKIDSAIARPGRFDFMANIARPTKERLVQYVKQGTLTHRMYQSMGLSYNDSELEETDKGFYASISKVVVEVIEASAPPLEFQWQFGILESVLKHAADLHRAEPTLVLNDIRIQLGAHLESQIAIAAQADRAPLPLVDTPRGS